MGAMFDACRNQSESQAARSRQLPVFFVRGLFLCHSHANSASILVLLKVEQALMKVRARKYAFHKGRFSRRWRGTKARLKSCGKPRIFYSEKRASPQNELTNVHASHYSTRCGSPGTKRLASGAFTDAEDVVSRALKVFDDEESWMKAGRQALDHKIDCALEQVAAVKTNGPEEAR